MKVVEVHQNLVVMVEVVHQVEEVEGHQILVVMVLLHQNLEVMVVVQ